MSQCSILLPRETTAELINRRRHMREEVAVANFRGNRFIRIENALEPGSERRLRARRSIPRGVNIFVATDKVPPSMGNALVVANSPDMLYNLVSTRNPALLACMYLPDDEQHWCVKNQYPPGYFEERLDRKQREGHEKLFRASFTEHFMDGHTRFYTTCAFLAMSNHSCWPNVCIVPRMEPTKHTHPSLGNRTVTKIKFSLHFFACQDIDEGDELTVSYLRDLYLPTNRRRQNLQLYHGFECACQRCSVASPPFSNDRLLTNASRQFSAARDEQRFERTKKMFDAIVSRKTESRATSVHSMLFSLQLAREFLHSELQVLSASHWRMFQVHDYISRTSVLLSDAYATMKKDELSQQHARVALESYRTMLEMLAALETLGRYSRQQYQIYVQYVRMHKVIDAQTDGRCDSPTNGSVEFWKSPEIQQHYRRMSPTPVPPTPPPTERPTNSPTAPPTNNPTTSPSASPTKSPTKSPTTSPTTSPSVSPTNSPTTSPTRSPTASPTDSPTDSPTATPTRSPTVSPTPAPTPECRITVDEQVVVECINQTATNIKFTLSYTDVRPLSQLHIEVSDATLQMDTTQSFPLNPPGTQNNVMFTMTDVPYKPHYFYSMSVTEGRQQEPAFCWINASSKKHVEPPDCTLLTTTAPSPPPTMVFK